MMLDLMKLENVIINLVLEDRMYLLVLWEIRDPAEESLAVLWEADREDKEQVQRQGGRILQLQTVLVHQTEPRQRARIAEAKARGFGKTAPVARRVREAGEESMPRAYFR